MIEERRSEQKSRKWENDSPLIAPSSCGLGAAALVMRRLQTDVSASPVIL